MSGEGSKTAKDSTRRGKVRSYRARHGSPKAGGQRINTYVSPEAKKKLSALCDKQRVGYGAAIEKLLDEIAFP